ncbi:hypothetical protein HKL94_02040 [Candidatus Parcubacteria bacterium]|nr:hypothetical protein [Candidatus Parcubacteria bacterium]
MSESPFSFPSVPAAVHTPPCATAREDERLSRLNFHLETGDYFPFLATLLGFVEETIASGDRSEDMNAIQLDAIKSARKDLSYLRDHYQITPRS